MAHGPAPSIAASTLEERLEYLRRRFECIGNCDLCGNCTFLHRRTPEEVYADYLAGNAEFVEVSMRNRR